MITTPGGTPQQTQNTGSTGQTAAQSATGGNARAVPAGSTLNSGDTLLNDRSITTGGASTGGAGTIGRPSITPPNVTGGSDVTGGSTAGPVDSGDTLLENTNGTSSEGVRRPRDTNRSVDVEPFSRPNPSNSIDRSGGPIRETPGGRTSGGGGGVTSGAPGGRY